jgi:TorA maturation chaperone TorD
MQTQTQTQVMQGYQRYQVFFELMGRSLHQVPSRALFGSLIEGRVFARLPLTIGDERFVEGATLLKTFDESMQGRLTDEGYHALLADNTRLFVGEQQLLCSPWESVYFNSDRQLFQEQTMQVRSWYRSHGLQIARLHHEPDDHIGLELEFVSHLLAEVIAAKEPERSHLLAETLRFIEEHPLRWIDQWAEGLLRHAHTDFYRGLALILPPALKDLTETIKAAGV